MTFSQTVSADAMFSGNTLELPIRCDRSTDGYVNYGGNYYKSGLNFIRQTSIVQETCGAEHVKEYSSWDSGTWLHIHLPGEDGRADDYVIRVHRSDCGGKPAYLISGMSAEVEDGTPEDNPRILLPCHLVSDACVANSIHAELYADAEYETGPRSNESRDPEDGGYSLAKRLNEF